MHTQAGKESPKGQVIQHAVRLYRAAARIQYTLLHSDSIDLHDAEEVEEILEFIDEAIIEANKAIEMLKILEK